MEQSLAAVIGLPPGVQEGVAAAYEQWDGKGWPGNLEGEAVPIAAGVSHFAEFIEVAHRSGGVDSAVDLARKLAGSQFDPDIASCFAMDAPDVVAELDGASAWGDQGGADTDASALGCRAR